MIRLLVVADDLTGALDTGVQFADYGVETRVVIRDDPAKPLSLPDTQVVVVDTESRHLDSGKAYEAVYSCVAAARKMGAEFFYKKTDSALRGNVGAELAAMLDAAGSERLHFIPAFPKMDRITRGGVHYISGTPVCESVFGQDPFEPVTCSRVTEIIAAGTELPACSVTKVREAEKRTGIVVYDAASFGDLSAIARDLKALPGEKVFAGCAGFAAVLPDIVPLRCDFISSAPTSDRILVVCGSINPISLTQCRRASASGAPYISINPRESSYLQWTSSGEVYVRAKETLAAFERSDLVLVGTLPEPNAAPLLRETVTPRQMAAMLGLTAKEVIEQDPGISAFVLGGDTLVGMMSCLGVRDLTTICELSPGVVLSRFTCRGETRYVISKSGGFGTPDLLFELRDKLRAWKDGCGSDLFTAS